MLHLLSRILDVQASILETDTDWTFYAYQHFLQGNIGKEPYNNDIVSNT